MPGPKLKVPLNEPELLPTPNDCAVIGVEPLNEDGLIAPPEFLEPPPRLELAYEYPAELNIPAPVPNSVSAPHCAACVFLRTLIAEEND